MVQAMAAAALAPVAGLGSSSLSVRAARSNVKLTSSFVQRASVRTAPQFENTVSTRGSCFNRDWLRKDLSVIGFGLIGWSAPSNLPIINGNSLTGLIFGSIGPELAHWPTGPAPTSPFCPRFSRGSVMQRRGRRGNGVVTKAIPVDAYWITATEAVAIAVLMGGLAAVAGVLINIRIEVQALAEFKELEEKGMLPDEFDVPDEDFDLEAPLYIFQNKQFPSSSSSSPSRNRPIREEFEPEPQLKPEFKTELEPATSKE